MKLKILVTTQNTVRICKQVTFSYFAKVDVETCPFFNSFMFVYKSLNIPVFTSFFFKLINLTIQLFPFFVPEVSTSFIFYIVLTTHNNLAWIL